MKRKNYSKELKSKVALSAIKGNQNVNEIASEFGIHASLITVSSWLSPSFEKGSMRRKRRKRVTS